MRRSKLFLFALVIALCSVLFCGIKFKATDLLTSDDILVKGAQVRTSDPMGIRFVGTASSTFVELESTEDGYVDYKYGVVIAFGELGQDDVLALTTESINGYSLLNAEVDSMDEDNQFYISLVNIPEEMYGQKVTARAYVKAGDTVTYSTDVVVRSFNYVVKEVYESGTGNDKVAELYNALPFATLDYNGGEYVSSYSFTVTRYGTEATQNSDDVNSGKYLTICSAANVTKGSNKWWYRIFLKEVFNNVYKVVAVTTSGEGNNTPTGIDYDYIIAAHSDALDTVSYKFVTNFITYPNATDYYVLFEMPTTQDCNVNIKVDKNFNLLANSNIYLEDGDSLPTLEKEHYTFNGWCTDKALTSETTLVYTSGNSYYAKYTANEYTVSYEYGEGTCSAELVNTYTVESDSIVLPTSSEMTIQNGEFLGWYDNADYKGDAITEIDTTNGGNITVYAKWDMITTTVTFEMNGGEKAINSEFIIHNFNDYSNGLSSGTTTGIVPIDKGASRMSYMWKRVLIKYNNDLGIWESVGVGSTSTSANDSNGNALTSTDATYVIGSHGYNTDTDSKNKIEAIFTAVSNGTKYYFDLGSFTGSAETTPTASGSWNQKVKAYSTADLLNGNVVEYAEETASLPQVQKDGYTFAGWYSDVNFESEEVTSITVGEADSSLNLYAKFDIVSYTISWDLSGGTCSAEYPTSYTIETDTITLPTASEMTMEGADFSGWLDASGETVTEITKGSTGNIELTAQWFVGEAQQLDITDADATALNSIYTDKTSVADMIVNYTITSASKYVLSNTNLRTEYADVEYVYGTSLFSNIADALESAQENDIIYVFAGTYSDTLTISTANVLLVGPNYEINGNGSRNLEANITGLTDIAAEGVIVNGFKFTSAGNVKISANNVTFACSIVSPSSTIGSAGSNRKAVLVSGISTKLTGVSILDNYLDTPGTVFGISTESIVMDNVSNCLISGNYITNSNVTAAGASGVYPGSQAMVRLYTVSGTLNITNNEFAWGTSGYSLEIANNANSCTEINIIENVFNNNGAYSTTAGINIRKGQTTTVTNIIGNKFYNVTGSTILATGDNGSTINIKYNLFGEGTAYKTGGIASATLVFSNNYYAAAQTTATSDVDTYSQDAAGLAQYEVDYAAYKAQ